MDQTAVAAALGISVLALWSLSAHSGALIVGLPAPDGSMKQPYEADFEIKHEGSNVIATFRPTGSRYSYSMLDKSEWPKHGKLSKVPNVRHAGPHGDTDEYIGADVAEMAYRLAELSVR
jgi:hypothetical protein